MKSFSLVVYGLVLFAAFAQGAERDCGDKCVCTNIKNKTPFCGIQGIKRVDFGSSCEMICHNCQHKTNFKYQSPGKCPTPTTAPVVAPAAAPAKAATGVPAKAPTTAPRVSTTTTPRPTTKTANAAAPTKKP